MQRVDNQQHRPAGANHHNFHGFPFRIHQRRSRNLGLVHIREKFFCHNAVFEVNVLLD